MSASTITPTTTSSEEPLRHRWQVWRSPAGQPRWARPTLLGIAALAALLYAWNITSSGYAFYYSVAARSMTVSWKAFLFTAFDPAATVTMDKIGGFLWPQAISARIFGFHAWALTLPQCIEGVVSVLAMYRMVRRWQGAAAGLLAAGLLTLTPVAASMFGHAMLDGSVTMCLVLAADQYQKAVDTGRLRSLMLSGLWIGLGFQAKMMEAWIIVPALATGYLVAAPHRLRRRMGQLLAAGVVLVAVSLSWLALMTLTPANSRPYADGSTNNSAFAMVFGYNGFNRFHEGLIKGAISGSISNAAQSGQQSGSSGAPGAPSQEGRQGSQSDHNGRAGQDGKDGKGGKGRRDQQGDQGNVPRQSSQVQPAGAHSGSPSSTPSSAPSSQASGSDPGSADSGYPGSGGLQRQDWFKLLGSRFAPQIGWLYPLALLALVLGLVRHRKGPRTDQERAGYLMWGVWLATAAGVLSAIDIPHTAYVATLAPALAALSAAGTITLWRAHCTARGGWRAWTLPATIVVEVSWTVYLASHYADFAPWLIPVVTVTALAAIVALGYTVRTRIAQETASKASPDSPVGPSAAAPAPRRRSLAWRIGLFGLVTGCVAMFAAPTVWSLSALNEQYAGGAFDASAGPPVKPPRAGHGSGGPGMITAASSTHGTAYSAARMPDPSTSLSSDQKKLLDYVQKHNGSAKYTFSTDVWTAAAPYIYAKGLPVLPLGGFSGQAKSYTLAGYKKLIAEGGLRFALFGNGGLPGQHGTAAGLPGGTASKISSWVKSACTKVDPKSYGVSTSTRNDNGHAIVGTGGGASQAQKPEPETLYHCTPADVTRS